MSGILLVNAVFPSLLLVTCNIIIIKAIVAHRKIKKSSTHKKNGKTEVS